MHNFSSCVLDTSVIIKSLFLPSHRRAGTTYSRELKTHKSCVALLALLDDQGIEVLLPRCGIIEIAAVSARLADSSIAEEICNEVETSFTIVPEDQLMGSAKKLHSARAARVLIPIFLRSPSRIQFLSLRTIGECIASVNKGQSAPGFCAI